MKRFVLFLIFLSAIFSQDVYAYAQNDVEYPEFRVLLKSFEWIEGRDGYFTSSALHGISKNGEEISISKSDIRRMQISSGSKAGQGALIGAGIGFLMSSLIYKGISSSADGVNKDIFMSVGVIPITAGITGAGVIIGLIAGGNRSEWEEVPIRTSFMFDPQEKGAKFAVSIQF